MTSSLLLLFALCASLFRLTSAQGFQPRVVSSWLSEETYDGVGGTQIPDCNDSQGSAIRQAVRDAFSLAGAARDALPDGLLPGGVNFFDRVFRDTEGVFSRTYVQGM
jgi:hypothetical protein